MSVVQSEQSDDGKKEKSSKKQKSSKEEVDPVLQYPISTHYCMVHIIIYQQYGHICQELTVAVC